jgi:hypothetical protein
LNLDFAIIITRHSAATQALGVLIKQTVPIVAIFPFLASLGP